MLHEQETMIKSANIFYRAFKNQEGNDNISIIILFVEKKKQQYQYNTNNSI